MPEDFTLADLKIYPIHTAMLAFVEFA